MSATPALSLGVAVLGVVVLALALARRLGLRVGLPMMLDLWIAASLLRLGGEPNWRALAAAASLLALRRLVAVALERDERRLDRA